MVTWPKYGTSSNKLMQKKYTSLSVVSILFYRVKNYLLRASKLLIHISLSVAVYIPSFLLRFCTSLEVMETQLLTLFDWIHKLDEAGKRSSKKKKKKKLKGKKRRILRWKGASVWWIPNRTTFSEHFTWGVGVSCYLLGCIQHTDVIYSTEPQSLLLETQSTL